MDTAKITLGKQLRYEFEDLGCTLAMVHEAIYTLECLRQAARRVHHRDEEDALREASWALTRAHALMAPRKD